MSEDKDYVSKQLFEAVVMLLASMGLSDDKKPLTNYLKIMVENLPDHPGLANHLRWLIGKPIKIDGETIPLLKKSSIVGKIERLNSE